MMRPFSAERTVNWGNVRMVVVSDGGEFMGRGSVASVGTALRLHRLEGSSPSKTAKASAGKSYTPSSSEGISRK